MYEERFQDQLYALSLNNLYVGILLILFSKFFLSTYSAKKGDKKKSK